MDEHEGLEYWARKDRDDLKATMSQLPPGRVEQMMQRALDLLDLAHAADNGQHRVSPLGPPSTRTAMFEWTEDLRQDESALTFFESRVLRLRPDLLPDHARFTDQAAWPTLRAGVARVALEWRMRRDILGQARAIDETADD